MALSLEQFHKQLVEQRETRTLSAIGEDLGVTHAAVQRWLKGSRPPSRTVLLLAESLWSTRLAIESASRPETTPGN